MALQYKPAWGQLLSRFACVALASLFLSQAAGAADPTSSCDPNYMNALEARAFLEAQREIAQNQNLILKPDSVLDYSCFAQFIGVVGDDSTLFSNQSPASGPSLAATLDSVVGDALETYLKYNFGESGPTYLGGRFSGNASEARDQSTSSYGCDQMAKVWAQARCMNFFVTPTSTGGGNGNGSGAVSTVTDSFFDFPWYVNKDPRQGTNNLSYNTAACSSLITQSTMDTAFNNNTKQYTVDRSSVPDYPDSNTSYTQDPVVTHLEQILPVGTEPADKCANPIWTGVWVLRAGLSYLYPEGVCSNPGCHYEKPGSGPSSYPADSTTPSMGSCVENTGGDSTAD